MLKFSRNRINRNRNRNRNQNENRSHLQSHPQIQHKDHQEQPQKKQNREHFDNLIPKNSIQNQFVLLTNQRDNFDRETQATEKELKEVQRQHQLIKNQHNSLFEANRQAKQELGQRIEKLSILKEEESRLRRLLKNEFDAIHGCTKHSKSLEKKKVELTNKHTKDITPLNFAAALHLEHRIQKKTERLISLRSIQAVVPILKKNLEREDKNKPQVQKKKEQFKKSINLLRMASNEHKECIALLGKLRAEQSRAGTAGVASTLQDNTNVRGNHVDLFYGRAEEWDVE